MASTASFTSCTRSMDAPPVNASVFAAIVAARACSASVLSVLYNIDLRDKPAKTGRPNV